jgi:hypothetical protein
MRQQRGERMGEVRVHGASAGERDELAALGRALADVQLAVEARELRRGHGVSMKTGDGAVGEVLHNAVLARRDLGMEAMPESFAFARQVATRLQQLGALPPAAVPHASTALAGLLVWMWGTQNVVSLPGEIVEGQVGVISELLASLRAHWPPADAQWFEDVRPFQDEIPTWLAELDELPYGDELYRSLDQIIERIERRAEELLARAEAREPARVPDAAAWILGCLVERNTWSYTDGSVPEDICDRLVALGARLGGKGEAFFWPWLERGFREVRERVPDELDRWRYGLGAPGSGPRAPAAASTEVSAKHDGA